MKTRNLAGLIGAGYGGLGAYSFSQRFAADFRLPMLTSPSGYEYWFQEFCGETLTKTLLLPLEIAWELADGTGLDNVLCDIGNAYCEVYELTLGYIIDNAFLGVVLGGALAGAAVFYAAGALIDLCRKPKGTNKHKGGD